MTLEQYGIMPKMKRFAGASAGSIAALLFAIGCNSHDVKQLLSVDMWKLIYDAGWWKLSLIPNLYLYFGWHPGIRIEEYLKEILKAKNLSPDITFQELYDETENELCVVVVNVNTMREEYFHVKTTPFMPVTAAVRMSLSIPGLFQSKTHKRYRDTDYYTDGGLLCNYPIQCFDGWWLSLDEKDSFIMQINKLENIVASKDQNERFQLGHRDNKTLGCRVNVSALDIQRHYRMEKLNVSII